ncbi:MAG: hypothetical protein IJB53_00665, partial [Mailhella sp.]|nr:hypothetical protein [Mailhella sp.]
MPRACLRRRAGGQGHLVEKRSFSRLIIFQELSNNIARFGEWSPFFAEIPLFVKTYPGARRGRAKKE